MTCNPNVVSLKQVRQERANHQAAVAADANRLIEASRGYSSILAADAYRATSALPGSDRHLHLVIERFFLRSGLTRSRKSWRKEYGKEWGSALAKMTAPIVTDAFWAKLDEINPLTCEVNGRIVPLIRGWRDASRRQSA